MLVHHQIVTLEKALTVCITRVQCKQIRSNENININLIISYVEEFEESGINSSFYFQMKT